MHYISGSATNANSDYVKFCICFTQGYEGDMSSQSTLNRSRSTGSLKSLGRGDSPGPLTRRKSMLEMPEFDGPSKHNQYLEQIVFYSKMFTGESRTCAIFIPTFGSNWGI